MAIWDKWFGNKGEKASRNLARARSDNPSDRLKLAKNKSTAPELLYYMAQNDKDVAVRRAVAKNKSTPVHASSILAADHDHDVRYALSQRLLRLLPELSEDKQGLLYQYAIDALGTLALDEVLKIRVALATTLKDHAQAPPSVVNQLARDVEREVSEPVLRFCAALSDEILLDIIKTHPSVWAVQAIAGRKTLSASVSGAVIDKGDEEAGRILLENSGTNIATGTFQNIIERARELPKWHKPIAIRKDLPKDLARELAEFVDEKVRTILLARTDFDAEDREKIMQVVTRRLAFMDDANVGREDVDTRLKRIMKGGKLDDDTLADALAVHDKELAVRMIAHMAGTKPDVVERIMALHTPKPVIALCWRAGVSMRMCLKVQRELATIAHNELIYPKGGTDYPLDEVELIWQLEFFSIPVK